MTTNFNDSFLLRKLPKGFIHNLQSSWLSTTTLSLSAGECRDSTNSVDMALDSPVTINSAIVGVNGIDVGTLANSTPYYKYLLNDTSGVLDPCGIISASASGPIMPTVNGVQYDAFRLVDWWMTGGSATFLKGYTRGNTTERTRYYDTVVATSVTVGASQTLAEISMAPAAPALDGMVAILQVGWTPAAANDTVSFAPFGSTATVLPRVYGSVGGKINGGPNVEVPCPLDSGVPKVLYINSAASGAVLVQVYGVRYVV